MQSGDKSPSEQQSPFLNSAQAPQSAVSPQPEAQSVSPPQAQMVGNVAQQQSTQFSATVNNPALNGSNIGSASSITTGYDMTEKKKGMNWKQFAIGFFAPIGIIGLLFEMILWRLPHTYVAETLWVLPLIGIVAIIVSFARGNKSLGYGMVTSIIGIPFTVYAVLILILMTL